MSTDTDPRWPKLEKCQRGHDMTDPKNVIIIKRSYGDERACRKCANKVKREWWRRNRAKG